MAENTPRAKRLTDNVKKFVAAKQKWSCAICHSLLPASFQIDHITAQSVGGTHEWDNLRALCPTCHAEITASQWRAGVWKDRPVCARAAAKSPPRVKSAAPKAPKALKLPTTAAVGSFLAIIDKFRYRPPPPPTSKPTTKPTTKPKAKPQ
jgi:HNH endonuclease